MHIYYKQISFYCRWHNPSRQSLQCGYVDSNFNGYKWSMCASIWWY